MEGLTVGRIVHYVLNAEDARTINTRHKAGNETPISERIPGVQYHGGNIATEGEHCAMVIVKTWDSEGLVNGKVLLDGLGDYWTTSRRYNEQKETGSWHWIEKA
jgi:hypothetical protein